MNRGFKLDAAFFVDCGDLNSVPNLSDSEIADRVEDLKCKIKQAAKNRRRRSDTRVNRIAEFERMREALITEMCKRIRPVTKLEICIPRNRSSGVLGNLEDHQ